jgi:hypothetical protein
MSRLHFPFLAWTYNSFRHERQSGSCSELVNKHHNFGVENNDSTSSILSSTIINARKVYTTQLDTLDIHRGRYEMPEENSPQSPDDGLPTPSLSSTESADRRDEVPEEHSSQSHDRLPGPPPSSPDSADRRDDLPEDLSTPFATHRLESVASSAYSTPPPRYSALPHAISPTTRNEPPTSQQQATPTSSRTFISRPYSPRLNSFSPGYNNHSSGWNSNTSNFNKFLGSNNNFFGPNSHWASLRISSDTTIHAPRAVLVKSPVLKFALTGGSTLYPPFGFIVGPEILGHILGYLNTDTFPLFWGKAEGFNFDLYQRVAHYAERFQLPELRDWILDQKYLDVVRVVCEESIEDFTPNSRLNVPGNVDVERRVVTQTLSVFSCPRRIRGHDVARGRPLLCSQQCLSQLRGRSIDDCYEMVPRRELVTLKRRYVFNPNLLKKSIF